MIKTDISFDKVCDNVTHFLEEDKKGVRNIEKANSVFACYANSVKVLGQYANNEYTVPTKAKQAKELLSKI
ncbi:hypothetical protein NVP1063O_195 [Vibrio phage 1.063.O._10N.261.45.C7]|nr:hypothetical protein NVP1063O_195 [Vibrio phage 1.063.O._10N.261.45.C7]